jgi:hypothetical protein
MSTVHLFAMMSSTRLVGHVASNYPEETMSYLHHAARGVLRRSLMSTSSIVRRTGLILGVAAAGLLAATGSASGQATIKVNENVNFRLGILLQAWVNFQQLPRSDRYTQEIFLRRSRFLFGGQIARDVTFFIQMDGGSLGRTTNGVKPLTTFFVQDAFMSVGYAKDQFLDAGLILPATSRGTLASTATILPLDYGVTGFLSSEATNSNAARDLGLQARGWLARGRVEYRVGVLEGHRDSLPTNPLRYNARIQVQLLDPEAKVVFPQDVYLTAARALALVAFGEVQQDYNAYTFEAFFSHPLGAGAQVTAQVNDITYNGGTTFPGLLGQHTYSGEAGLYFKRSKLMPFAHYETQRHEGTVHDALDLDRYQLGLTYYWRGFNGNVKGAWVRVTPNTGPSSNQFTMQLQAFYY